MTRVPRRARLEHALLAVLCLTVACVTRGQVQQIVAETNVNMVSPYIDIAGATQGDWQQAVAGIDEFIDTHPDNSVLVNQLRLRQAMLFTDNLKPNLADQRWEQVQLSELKNERDRSLKRTGPDLSWWYQAAADGAKIDADQATAALATIDDVLPSTSDGSDIRIYLCTIRAQIVARQGRDSLLPSPETELPAALASYIAGIGADETWIADLDNLDLTAARHIRAFRYRIWLQEMIGSYKRAATDLGVGTDVDWKPDWVDGVR